MVKCELNCLVTRYKVRLGRARPSTGIFIGLNVRNFGMYLLICKLMTVLHKNILKLELCERLNVFFFT